MALTKQPKNMALLVKIHQKYQRFSIDCSVDLFDIVFFFTHLTLLSTWWSAPALNGFTAVRLIIMFISAWTNQILVVEIDRADLTDILLCFPLLIYFLTFIFEKGKGRELTWSSTTNGRTFQFKESTYFVNHFLSALSSVPKANRKKKIYIYNSSNEANCKKKTRLETRLIQI